MLRSSVAALAFFALCGFTEQDACTRFAGGWQSKDDVQGTTGAIRIDPVAHTVTARAYTEIISGKVDRVEIMGRSATFYVGKQSVVIHSSSDPAVIDANVGSTPTMRFVRVP